MNSKSPVNAVTASLKAKYGRRPSSKLTIDEATTEIAQALNIHRDAAAMTLYGLCATSSVRWLDGEGEVIDEDECTIGNFNDKPKFVIASDVRSFLTDWSPDPQPSKRKDVIAAMIADGLIPGSTVEWKKFSDGVRDRCNGWRAKGKPAWGFSDKQIQREVKDLRGK